jgi:hypothetical protein
MVPWFVNAELPGLTTRDKFIELLRALRTPTPCGNRQIPIYDMAVGGRSKILGELWNIADRKEEFTDAVFKSAWDGVILHKVHST